MLTRAAPFPLLPCHWQVLLLPHQGLPSPAASHTCGPRAQLPPKVSPHLDPLVSSQLCAPSRDPATIPTPASPPLLVILQTLVFHTSGVPSASSWYTFAVLHAAAARKRSMADGGHPVTETLTSGVVSLGCAVPPVCPLQTGGGGQEEAEHGRRVWAAGAAADDVPQDRSRRWGPEVCHLHQDEERT